MRSESTPTCPTALGPQHHEQQRHALQHGLSQTNAARTKIPKVKVGDTIGFGTNLGAQIQHSGSIQVYMSKAPGAVASYDGSGDRFKIYQFGPKSFLTADASSWKVYNKNRMYGGAKTYPFPGPALISSGKNAKREEEVEERDVDEGKPRFSRRYAPKMESLRDFRIT
ncbi:cellulose-growth-specific protein [Colletotrichum sojae]|uniref:Cellulose-growth-specific protein n=1 Tax=Colletotrichum sojae TaxID=2175907 RepID=A0A8H6J6K5_9PEZI|nr:cellulose-growth-specific protein [Colletotrichum sojae]